MRITNRGVFTVAGITCQTIFQQKFGKHMKIQYVLFGKSEELKIAKNSEKLEKIHKNFEF